MSIYKKLLSLQKSVVGLTKDKSGNSYQYISGDKLLGIVRPKMDELGLLLLMDVVDSNFERIDYTLYDRQGNPKPKSEIFCSLSIKFTWVDAESGETVVCMWASSGMNNWDKGLGSALTYGERYFLLKFLHLQTDKDDVDYPRDEEAESRKGEAIGELTKCKTKEELLEVWNAHASEYGNDQDFRTAYMKQLNVITNANKQ